VGVGVPVDVASTIVIMVVALISCGLPKLEVVVVPVPLMSGTIIFGDVAESVEEDVGDAEVAVVDDSLDAIGTELKGSSSSSNLDHISVLETVCFLSIEVGERVYRIVKHDN
jgi:hypothetical protein